MLDKGKGLSQAWKCNYYIGLISCVSRYSLGHNADEPTFQNIRRLFLSACHPRMWHFSNHVSEPNILGYVMLKEINFHQNYRIMESPVGHLCTGLDTRTLMAYIWPIPACCLCSKLLNAQISSDFECINSSTLLIEVWFQSNCSTCSRAFWLM